MKKQPTPELTRELDELHNRLWARDPALAGECLDLLAGIRRRLLAQYSHLGAFLESLDNIPQIRCIPGSGIDGYRDAKNIRAIVETLCVNCDRTWENRWPGELKSNAVGTRSTRVPLISPAQSTIGNPQ